MAEPVDITLDLKCALLAEETRLSGEFVYEDQVDFQLPTTETRSKVVCYENIKVAVKTSDRRFLDRNKFPGLRYIAAMDISYADSSQDSCDTEFAVACFVIFDYLTEEIKYLDLERVELEFGYQPGFFALKEGKQYIEMYERFAAKAKRENFSELRPQVLVVDGNGTLHPRGFGLACHIGTTLKIPTIGIAKNYLSLPFKGLLGMNSKQLKRLCALVFSTAPSDITVNGVDCRIIGGDWILLNGKKHESNFNYGAILNPLKVCGKDSQPLNSVYVSCGWGLSLETAVLLVLTFSSLLTSGSKLTCYRIPQPIRMADHLSRDAVRLLKANQEEKRSVHEVMYKSIRGNFKTAL